jgi:hypothetical protein
MLVAWIEHGHCCYRVSNKRRIVKKWDEENQQKFCELCVELNQGKTQLIKIKYTG